MKDEEKMKVFISHAIDDEQKLLRGLDDYISNLKKRLSMAEANAIETQKLREKESAEYFSKLEVLKQKHKEEKASWSSKERSYESKIKMLAEENNNLSERIRSMNVSSSEWSGYLHGRMLSDDTRYDDDFDSATDHALDFYRKGKTRLWNEVKDLRSKIENDYIEVEHLEESIKDYTDEKGYDEAYEIFERLNTLLAGVDPWTAAIKRLKKFFREKKKEIKEAGGNRTINISGDHPTYNETYND